MATNTTKKTTKMVEKVKEVLPESPDAADALASTAFVSVAKNLDLAKEAKDETVVPAEEPPDMPKQPEWQKALEEDYGHIIRNRDQTALLTAILTELVKIRVR